MSKYSDDLARTMRDIRALRSATRSVIGKGNRLALEKFHDANSLAKLKKMIREKR